MENENDDEERVSELEGEVSEEVPHQQQYRTGPAPDAIPTAERIEASTLERREQLAGRGLAR